MGQVIIDLRFAEISGEIWGLQTYLDLVERHLPLLTTAQRDHFLMEFRAQGSPFDSTEVQLALQFSDEMERQVLPRLLLAPFIVSLWGLFESAVVEIAEYIRAQRGVAIAMSDLRGDFIARTEKYFQSALQYEFSLDPECWEALRAIATVRNCFAHANGRLSAVREPERVALLQITRSREGLSLDGDFIVPSIPFLRKSFTYIRSTLEDLIGRVQTGFSTPEDD